MSFKMFRFVPVLVLGLSSYASAAEVGYYSQPALYDNRIVFVSEGDLWTATIPQSAEETIIAYRLTSSDGNESKPTFNSNGQSIAFTAQYDGNTDVFVMSIDGGPPKRLTFHGDRDEALCWSADGSNVLFRSPRKQPLGRTELWSVSVNGGTPHRFEFGECSLASLSTTGRQIAFTRWSNENWTWKRYRGGTAPEIWVGEFAAQRFSNITNNEANDLFPMWVLGKICFLSDRTGTANIFSDSTRADSLKQHTFFAPVADNPTAIEGYDIRWPSADAKRRGSRIIFCQGGSLTLLDIKDNSIRRLDIKIASDRVASRERFAEPLKTATEFSLSPDGDRLIIGSRGDVLSLPVKTGPIIQLAHTSSAREWGASYLADDQVIMISDASGEQQVVVAPADGSLLPSLITEDRKAWLFPPIGSPNGQWIAFADKTQRLYSLNTISFIRKQVDFSDAWEIVDYRFSPDSNWLSYTKPMPNGYGMIFIHSLRTGRSFAVSNGLHDDGEPRWDPAGKYLYYLSKSNLDPVIGEIDFEHVNINTTVIYAVPLTADAPPPIRALADAVEFDFDTWAKGKPQETEEQNEADQPAEQDDNEWIMRVDTEGLHQRQFLLPIQAGNFSQLEAIDGAITYLSEPTLGMIASRKNRGGFEKGNATLHHYDFSKETDKVLAEKISSYAVSSNRKTIAHPTTDGFTIIDPTGAEEDKNIDVSAARLRIDAVAEWKQIFDEAWRLQRDFFWADNFAGLDWDAMREKYSALLPRIGNRNELNDLVGEMIGELGNSHSYIRGGEHADSAKTVSVGLLGADVAFENGSFVIKRILPRQPWDDSLQSPLAAKYLGVSEGNVIHKINGTPLTPFVSIHDLLQDQAGKIISLSISDDATSRDKRTIYIKALATDRPLRYAAWVEDNRKYVADKSQGQIGYLHIPNMMGQGLVAFNRYFYPQIEKKALLIDIRSNGGGFVSQMIIDRLSRKVWAFMKPRHGQTSRYPAKSLHGHLAVLIDQHAGSDGDIFPESFRIKQLGTIIGTRTWGGVVGIRGDKPFVDMGVSTQPEFAWWEPTRGWSLENRGVSPDIEVDITPNDRLAGLDPQLDKAIEVLLAKLKEDPKDLPEPPPLPDRGR